MDSGRLAHTAGVGVAFVLAGSLTAGSAAEGDTFDVELRVMSYRALDPADVDRARQTATDLLATAGLRTDWRSCLGAACQGPSETPRVILVLLLPLTKRDAADTSGEVVREPTTKTPTVVVYVPRNVEITQEIRRSRAGRSHPALTTLAPGHVIGLTIAHETGHALGLSHSSAGPMKSRPGPDDVIAMREGRLRFPRITLDGRYPVTSGAVVWSAAARHRRYDRPL